MIIKLMKQISDLEVSGKRVLLRADLDVPLSDVEQEESSTRLTNLKPSIDLLFDSNARITIIGHIDRPQKPDPRLSTKQLIDPLQKILKRTVVFKSDFDDKSVDVPELASQITLFENLRFWPGELANNAEFALKLSSLGDFFVNDAFSDCHRNHASMVALPKLLPSVAGVHLLNEISELTKVTKNPDHPLVIVVGGAKIETKLPVVENLAKIADFVLIGGELPLEIQRYNTRVADNVVVAELNDDRKDLSSTSIEKFVKVIKAARLIVWNGPQGLFEDGYSHGTLNIARAIIESGAHSIVGGGETTQFLETNKLLSKFSFVSAGGGAMLEFLAGKRLPGLEALGEVGS